MTTWAADDGSAVSIVIPTIGRPSLREVLTSVFRSASTTGRPLPAIYVVDDRPGQRAALDLGPSPPPVTVLHSGGRGPAAARNVGWRRARADWVAFLDDDVQVSPSWLADLAADLDQPPSVAGVQGRISVPLPAGRPPTDWERGTAGLETGRWITADMAYRRSALQRVGGFDERFARAFREDSDLALRVLDARYELVQGQRRTVHPVRPAGWWASLHQQRGNADDVLMTRLHGRDWRRRAEAPLGRRPLHLLTTGLALAVPAAVALRRPLPALAAAAGCAGLTADFSWRRIRGGPRDAVEVAKMVTTSAAIPFAATWHWARANLRHWRTTPQWRLPAAVLVDRDGTIVRDVPYNGDPSQVWPMPDAAAALGRLRSAGIPVAVVSNQSGIGRGLVERSEVDAVNARVEELLGPFDGWFVCPHTDADGCHCRKPMPGLVQQAAASLGVAAQDCVVIGDIGADMVCARSVGASAILVPTSHTLAAEVLTAPRRAGTLTDAVDLILSGRY